MLDVGKEYGSALFALACENGAAEAYATALGQIEDAFSAHPEYPLFLASPAVPLGERQEAIRAAFSTCLPEDVVSFLLLLCEKGRIACFAEAVREYRALLDASRRVSAAKVCSATPLTEAEKEKLKTKLEALCGGTVRMEYTTDASLLGGLLVEVDGKILDGSLRHRLRDVKDVMKK